jgi:hypothetical protein
MSRNGEAVDKNIMRLCIESFVKQGKELGKPELYQKDFEDHFLKSSQAEYERKARTWSTECNAREYLDHVAESCLHEEQAADYMLQVETKPKLIKCVELELITKVAEVILDKDTGCNKMFKDKLLDDLKILYSCFQRDESTLKPIIQRMSDYIQNRGKVIVEDE